MLVEFHVPVAFRVVAMDNSVRDSLQSISRVFGQVTVHLPQRKGIRCYQGRNILNREVFFRQNLVGSIWWWARTEASEAINMDGKKFNPLVGRWRFFVNAFVRSCRQTFGVQFHDHALIYIICERPDGRGNYQHRTVMRRITHAVQNILLNGVQSFVRPAIREPRFNACPYLDAHSTNSLPAMWSPAFVLPSELVDENDTAKGIVRQSHSASIGNHE